MENIYNVELVQNNDELEKIEIELLLEGIYRYYGFDFRNYSYSSLRRRIWYRVEIEKLGTITNLLEKALHSSSIMEKLISDFSINVTEMFRDPSFFLSFRNKVIPILRMSPTIRIWHAGCSTGEEVYSMAILLHEEGLYNKTSLYATDMNLSVLQKAKRGIYPLDNMQKYTSNYFKSGGKKSFSEYYTANHEGVKFHSYLRENIIFEQHNLATDHSFNDFNVILCRNVLIYFNKSLQNHVHGLFYDSLKKNGFIGLGHKESISFTSHAHSYEDIDSQEKIYQKIY